MRLLVTASLVLAGCGSSWDIRKGDKLGVGCAESFFYADVDGDGWGDPDSEPQPMCDADVAAGLTANNGRDCSDDDIGITGLVGTSCPEGLVGAAVGAVAHGGVVFDQSEFAYVHGAGASVVRFGSAATSCEGWGGSVLEDEAWVGYGTLATFGSQAELDEVLGTLNTAVDTGTGVYAGFVGIHWDGPDAVSGAWSWVGDADDGLITSDLDWCDAEPLPTDFFPLLNPLDPDHAAAIVSQLADIRLALVYRQGDAGMEWCLGLPWQAIPADIYADMQAGRDNQADPYVADVSRYSVSDAHLVCRRPQPDPDNYVHFSE